MSYYGSDKGWSEIRLTLSDKRRWLLNATCEDLLSHYKTVLLFKFEEDRKRGGFLQLKDDVELAENELACRLKSKPA